MMFWKKSKPNYSHDEVEKAEMLEVHTRWIKDEKLSRKQKQLLKTSQEYPELDALKQLIDFAHYRFRETASVTLRPGAKQRIASQLMERIGHKNRSVVDDLLPDIDELSFSRASPEQVGSDSELASPSIPADLSPLSQIGLFADNLDGETISERVSPSSVDDSYNLKLKVIQGDEVGRECNIAFLKVIIGRGADATVQLETNEPVSDRCASLTIEGDQIYITDLGGSDATYVDNRQIFEPTLLHVGSKITIGEQSFEVTEIQRDAGILRISFLEIEGKNVGQVFCLSIKEVTVGRGKGARLRFSDSTGTLSRLHAQFQLKKGEVYITDLESTNGTYVDGVRIEVPTILRKGSIIRFGGITCEAIDIGNTS